MCWLCQRRCSTPGLISTTMGNHQWLSKPSQYVASHSGRLSLAIPPWVDAVSAGRSWGVIRHTAWCTHPYHIRGLAAETDTWLRAIQKCTSMQPSVVWEELYLLTVLLVYLEWYLCLTQIYVYQLIFLYVLCVLCFRRLFLYCYAEGKLHERAFLPLLSGMILDDST